jgi:tetratricopeptide (TPR) repeat protein
MRGIIIPILILFLSLFIVTFNRTDDLVCTLYRESALLIFLKDLARNESDNRSYIYLEKQCGLKQHLRIKGLFDFYLGDKHLGIDDLSKKYDLDPYNHLSVIQLRLVAKHYQEQGDFAVAIPLLLKIGDSASLMEIGTEARARGDWQIAIDSFQAAVDTQRLGKDTYLAHFLMAKVWWYGLRDFENAKTEFIIAHYLDPDNYYVCRDAAEVWSQARSPEEYVAVLPHCSD